MSATHTLCGGAIREEGPYSPTVRPRQICDTCGGVEVPDGEIHVERRIAAAAGTAKVLARASSGVEPGPVDTVTTGEGLVIHWQFEGEEN